MMRKLLKKQRFVPDAFVTDKLSSYGAALKDLGLTKHHDFGGRKNNRSREFSLACPATRTTNATFQIGSISAAISLYHATVYNTFNVQRHLISRKHCAGLATKQ